MNRRLTIGLLFIGALVLTLIIYLIVRHEKYKDNYEAAIGALRPSLNIAEKAEPKKAEPKKEVEKEKKPVEKPKAPVRERYGSLRDSPDGVSTPKCTPCTIDCTGPGCEGISIHGNALGPDACRAAGIKLDAVCKARGANGCTSSCAQECKGPKACGFNCTGPDDDPCSACESCSLELPCAVNEERCLNCHGGDQPGAPKKFWCGTKPPKPLVPGNCAFICLDNKCPANAHRTSGDKEGCKQWEIPDDSWCNASEENCTRCYMTQNEEKIFGLWCPASG